MTKHEMEVEIRKLKRECKWRKEHIGELRTILRRLRGSMCHLPDRKLVDTYFQKFPDRGDL